MELGNGNSGIQITGGSSVVTGAMAAGPLATAHAGLSDTARSTSKAAPAEDAGRSRKVFVVHGRDDAARAHMFDLVRRLDLHPVDWETLVSETSNASPFLGEVLDKAFEVTQAVLVVLTPDDVAYLHPSLHGEDEPDFETRPTCQARPNVIFEAGMALGMKPHRTVIVKIGRLRPFSDLDGRNFIKYDGSPESALKIAQRLQTAGCPSRVSTALTELARNANLDAYYRRPPS